MYFSYFQLIFGNTNDETRNVIRRDLDSPIHAEKVKFIPKMWQRVPCLRVELCGKVKLCFTLYCSRDMLIDILYTLDGASHTVGRRKLKSDRKRWSFPQSWHGA